MRGVFILAAVFALSLLIIVHEGGHYIVARLCKMDVETFSLGMGPGVIRKRIWGTTFQIAPIPFGGFVHIRGMQLVDEVDPNDEHAYPNRPAWQRFLTIFAGPATNFLFAIVLAIIYYTSYGATQRNAVDGFAKDSPAISILEKGDEILSVNGEPIYSRVDGRPVAFTLTDAISAGGGAPIEMEIKRGDTTRKVQLTPRVISFVDQIDASTGLVPGDVVVAINGVDTEDMLRQLGDSTVGFDGQPLGEGLTKINRWHAVRFRDVTSSFTLAVRRDGERKEFAVTPEQVADMQLSRGLRIGVNLTPVRVPNFGNEVVTAFKFPYLYSAFILDHLYTRASQGKAPDVTGPVGIYGAIKSGIQSGWERTLELLMFLNVSLGLFNLFPIPALDGGRLIFLGYELVTRKRANQRVESYLHMFGAFLLIGILVLVTLRDCGL